MPPTASSQKKAIDKAAPAADTKLLFSHGANARSHAIIVIMASKTNLPANVAIVVDMLLTNTVSSARKNLQYMCKNW